MKNAYIFLICGVLVTSQTALAQFDFLKRIKDAVQSTITGQPPPEQSNNANQDTAQNDQEEEPVYTSKYVHSAPVILKARDYPRFAGNLVTSYRLFKTDKNGKASVIPFQIDELNSNKDYIVDEGKWSNKKTGNRIFDRYDELSFMGDDVGYETAPTSWPEGRKPSWIYKVTFEPPAVMSKYSRKGAVFVGVYLGKPMPKLSEKYYVQYDPIKSVVQSSRYIYKFDKKNQLVVNGIEVKNPKDGSETRLVDASSMYLRADLKYFLTLTANHRTVQSDLEGYRRGPIRSIVRIKFFYQFLKMNFELGMFTEVSFFANSVVLPAIMFNPIDGTQRLKKGSQFYYGFALRENPKNYKVQTNMPYVTAANSLSGSFGNRARPKKNYYASITGKNQMFHLDIGQSYALQRSGNIPMIYKEDKDGPTLLKLRSNDRKSPLGKSPVNLGIYFDLSKFAKGEHKISFQMFFENRYSKRDLLGFQNLSKWIISTNKI